MLSRYIPITIHPGFIAGLILAPKAPPKSFDKPPNTLTGWKDFPPAVVVPK